ncbi:MAG: hypothetical protein ACFFDY_12310 [Candidatus Thorarchaeota archaeon]
MTFLIFTIFYISVFVALGAILTFLYIRNYKEIPIDVWKPNVAWLRAFIYFSFCNIVIAASGTLEQLIIQPLFTRDQITNHFWFLYCIFCFIYVFFAYWILWSRMTITFNRKYYLGSEILFGVIWGYSTGGILLSFYHFWSFINIPNWVHYLLSFASMSIWQYFIQDYFWDIYVSPEHDTPRSIIIKTLVCHIPIVTISLGFLTFWNNYAIFILFFIFALIASSIFQKFPAPWVKGEFHAPMVKPGIGGLPHGSGYLSEKENQSNKE